MKHPSDATREALAHDLARLYVHVLNPAPDPTTGRDFVLGALIALGVAFALVPWVWLIAIWWRD